VTGTAIEIEIEIIGAATGITATTVTRAREGEGRGTTIRAIIRRRPGGGGPEGVTVIKRDEQLIYAVQNRGAKRQGQ